MQTTLLGVAIALILALVTALVAPLFIDWGSYRGEFETRARRLTGLDFRVTGAIDARLLPTPTVVLEGIEFGRPEEGSKVRARLLRIEFALGALVRGEWRIAEARLEGPEFTAGLDGSGRLAWPVPKLGFDLEGVSIARLQIQDGRASLADGAIDAGVVLDQLEFTGEVTRWRGRSKARAPSSSPASVIPIASPPAESRRTAAPGCALRSIRSISRWPPKPTSRFGSSAACRASKAASNSRARSAVRPRARSRSSSNRGA